MRIYRFEEMFESVAIHRNIKQVRLPYCNTLQSKGYRIAEINGESYAFTKNYDVDDEIYYLGVTNADFIYGKKYLATSDLILNKDSLPFYCLYSRCDSALTPDQQKLKIKMDKDHIKQIEQKRKEAIKEKELRKKKKTK